MRRRFYLILGAFVLSVTALALISFLMRQRLNNLLNSSDWVEHSYKVIAAISHLESSLTASETAVRGFVLTGDSSFLNNYASSNENIRKSFDSLSVLTADNGTQRNRMQLMRGTINTRLSYLEQLSDRRLIKDTASRRRIMLDGKRAMDVLFADCNVMQQEEFRLLTIRKAGKAKYEKVTPAYLNGLFTISIVLIILSTFFILRELVMRYKYQKELEIKIMALNQAKSELEQIAEISSHDLLEPLRKLQLFGTRLLRKGKDMEEPDVKLSLERIHAAASLMRILIEDLSAYNDISQGVTVLKPVDLNNALKKSIESLQLIIKEKNAAIHFDSLPLLDGSEGQLGLLFRHLLENSLKFSKPGVSPEIVITYSKEDATMLSPINKKAMHRQYHIITIRDNGIGFDPQYGERIFHIFRRLHAHDAGYAGKGIGLAICRKIIANHQAYITATGKPGDGATFTIFFPAAGSTN